MSSQLRLSIALKKFYQFGSDVNTGFNWNIVNGFSEFFYGVYKWTVDNTFNAAQRLLKIKMTLARVASTSEQKQSILIRSRKI